VIEFQTKNYPPGCQFNPVITTYGFAVDEMIKVDRNLPRLTARRGGHV